MKKGMLKLVGVEIFGVIIGARNFDANDYIRVTSFCEHTEVMYRNESKRTNKRADIDKCGNGSESCENKTVSSKSQNRSCQAGYKFDSERNDCIDLNECDTLPCNSREVCVNSPGSYKCNCDVGFVRDHITGACVDVNECQVNLHNCDTSWQRCDNTIGSYHCVRSVGCGTGYTFNSHSGHCDDDDECSLGTDNCKSLGPSWECKNTLGSFRCEKKHCDSRNCTRAPTLPAKAKKCSPGFERSRLDTCIDIDECKKTSTCKGNLKCINLIGSYRCVPPITCVDGLRLNGTTNTCSDVDECKEQIGICEHNCINLWGSFVCTCRLGFVLHEDKRSCVDFNECEMSGERRICTGTCVNTPGSYRCQCPDGYQLSQNKAGCEDINECAVTNKCKPEETCFNVIGSHRCYTIECPVNYEIDQNRKNRCIRAAHYCRYELSEECLQTPISYSFNYHSLVSNMSIRSSGFSELINLQGPPDGSISTDYSLKIVAIRKPASVLGVEDDYFTLKRIAWNSVAVALKKPIMGPQDIELQLRMDIYSNGTYVGYNLCKLFLYVSQYEF